MPMVSQKQRAYLWANHPEIARRYERHTPKGKKLPKRKRRKRGSLSDRLRNR